MWQRSELKTRAKQTMNLCYWQAVLAALVLGLSGGGTRFQLNFRGNKDNCKNTLRMTKNKKMKKTEKT